MTQRKEKLAGKIVLVVGASSGLGSEIAYAAAKEQATVIVCARRVDLLAEVKEKCESLAGRAAYAFPMDVTQPTSIEQTYDDITSQVGTVDVLVNCAGFGLFKEFLDFEMSVAERMFNVNVLGTMYVSQKFALQMAERGRGGHIINIASQAGKTATVKSSIYAATKFAVIGFSNALRLELKPLGIQVTTVNPGPIATDFFEIADESGEYLTSMAAFVLQPQPLAERIVKSFLTKRREINAPFVMDVASKAYMLFPHIGDYLTGTIFNNK